MQDHAVLTLVSNSALMRVSSTPGIAPRTVAHRLTAAQYEAPQRAATRPSRALEPLPPNIKGAAKQSVLAALVARGYAVKCYLPGHVEYVLTDAGLALFLTRDAAVGLPGAGVQPLIIAPNPADLPVAGR